MGKIYLLFYIILVVYAKYTDGIAQILAISFGLFFGFLFAVADRNIRLKKQGLKMSSFYDAFKKDFNTLVLCIKNIPKGIGISVIWSSKTIFKGLKWLFKPEHIRLFFFLIKEGICLFFAFVFTVWVFVFMFTFSV